MAERAWHVSKIQYCEHAGQEIALETEVVYPAEHLSEQAPRVRSPLFECHGLQPDGQDGLHLVRNEP